MDHSFTDFLVVRCQHTNFAGGAFKEFRYGFRSAARCVMSPLQSVFETLGRLIFDRFALPIFIVMFQACEQSEGMIRIYRRMNVFQFSVPGRCLVHHTTDTTVL
eukprot:g63724.t1